MPFIFSSIRREFMTAFTDEVSKLAMEKQSQIIDRNNILEFQHGNVWLSPENKLGDQKTEMRKLSTETALHMQELVSGKAVTIFRHVRDISQAMHDSFMKGMIARFEEVTSRTGNVVKGSSASMADSLINALEKLEPSVDEEGELRMPTVMIHPSQTEQLQKEIEKDDPETKKRLEEVKSRKLREAKEKEILRLQKFEVRKE